MTEIRDLSYVMKKQLLDQRRGELVREGVKIAIVGPPNAGKSSLFNLLAARDAAIVSASAGTTRDVWKYRSISGEPSAPCRIRRECGVKQTA